MTRFKGFLFIPSIALAAATFSCASSVLSGGGSIQKGTALEQSAGKDGASDGGSLGNSDGADGDGMNGLGRLDSEDEIGLGRWGVFGDGSSGANGGGDGNSNGTGGSSDGDGGSGGKNNDPDDDDGPGKNKHSGDDPDDDDEMLAKTKYGAIITRLLADDSFSLKIEVLLSGKVVNTANLSFGEGGRGKFQTAAAVCRAGRDTCMRLTFTNTDGNHSGHVETAGVTPCVFVQESGTLATIDVDTNGGDGGGMHKGTCRPGEDERLTISCPHAKSLKVQACGT